MGTFAATNVTTYLGGYDLTGDLNSTVLNLSTDPKPCTPFGSTAVKRVAGFRDVECQSRGYWQAGTDAVDPAVFTNLTSLQVATHTPTGTELDVAYFYQTRSFQYEMPGEAGEVFPFALSMSAARGNGTLSVGAVRGRLLKAKGNVSATGALGTGYQLGAVSATQYLYGVLHIFSAGTTITAVLESDDNSGFTSATTRATIGPLTTTGGTWATRVAGAITDDYYRFRVTAITGTFSVAGAAGIR